MTTEEILALLAQKCNSPSEESLDKKLVDGIALALTYLDIWTVAEIVCEATGSNPEAFLEALQEEYKKHEIIHFYPSYGKPPAG